MQSGNITKFEGSLLGSCNSFVGNYSNTWPAWSVIITYEAGSEDWTGRAVTLFIEVPDSNVVWGSVQKFMFCDLGSSMTLGPESGTQSWKATCSIPGMNLSLIVEQINYSKVKFMVRIREMGFYQPAI